MLAAVITYDNTNSTMTSWSNAVNSYFTKSIYCSTLGKIIDSSFYGLSIIFNATNPLNSSYEPYYSGVYNTLLSSCTLKSLATGKTLNVDNQTWIKSGKSIAVDGNGYLTLNIDHLN